MDCRLFQKPFSLLQLIIYRKLLSLPLLWDISGNWVSTLQQQTGNRRRNSLNKKFSSGTWLVSWLKANKIRTILCQALDQQALLYVTSSKFSCVILIFKRINLILNRGFNRFPSSFQNWIPWIFQTNSNQVILYFPPSFPSDHPPSASSFSPEIRPPHNSRVTRNVFLASFAILFLPHLPRRICVFYVLNSVLIK